jgi:hypothetical protein
MVAAAGGNNGESITNMGRDTCSDKITNCGSCPSLTSPKKPKIRPLAKWSGSSYSEGVSLDHVYKV